jgi:gluconate 5-dehydrogenase
VLINTAAMRVNKPPEATSLAEWRAVMDTNITGTFRCCREAGKVMISQHSGKIINIASISGHIVNKYFHGGSYEISKAALMMLTKTLATEWAQHNISVNAIAPGYYDTQPNRDFFAGKPDLYGKVLDMIPQGRLGNLQELSDLVLMLASDIANYMTGTTITIDGATPLVIYGTPCRSALHESRLCRRGLCTQGNAWVWTKPAALWTLRSPRQARNPTSRSP